MNTTAPRPTENTAIRNAGEPPRLNLQQLLLDRAQVPNHPGSPR